MKSLTVLIILTFPIAAFAQGTSTGEANLKFLFPARILSMAGAAIADTENATASFINPACLANGKLVEVSFSQLQWIQDVQTQILGTSVPLSVGTAAFAISSTNVADIPLRDVPGPEIGSFTAHSTVFQLGYAVNVIPEISVGGTVKYIYDKLFIDEASGYGLDLGVLYNTPLKGLSLGAAVTNIGQVSAFRTEKTDLPTNIDIGADYVFSNGDFDFVSALALGKETMSDGMSQVRIGEEITYDKLVAIRAGYQTGYDIRGLSLGLGIHYSLLQLDYAYVPFSEGFGDANILTIGINF